MPFYSTYQRLGCPVWASDRDVVRAVEAKLRPEVRRAPGKRSNRHAIYRAILSHHHDAQALCRAFHL